MYNVNIQTYLKYIYLHLRCKCYFDGCNLTFIQQFKYFVSDVNFLQGFSFEHCVYYLKCELLEMSFNTGFFSFKILDTQCYEIMFMKYNLWWSSTLCAYWGIVIVLKYDILFYWIIVVVCYANMELLRSYNLLISLKDEIFTAGIMYYKRVVCKNFRILCLFQQSIWCQNLDFLATLKTTKSQGWYFL